MARWAICTGVCPELCELKLGGRALRIEAGEQHLLLFARRQPQCELAGGRGLAGALQADHQEGDGGRSIQRERHCASAAQRFDQRIVDDLGNLLAGGDGRQHFRADGPLAHPGDEILHHRQRHVGIEHRQAHFAQRLGDVGLAQRAPLAEPVEDAGEFVRQRVEHG
jgi:hypothetical protein